MRPPPQNFSSTADTLIGCLLCTCSVLGIFLNLPAIAYFTTRPSTNNNSSYFSRLYCLISIVDLLISASLFPFIDAAFSPGRDGKYFTSSEDQNSEVREAGPPKSDSPGVCKVWAVLWKVLPEMSVFLVASVSVSRLLLLRTPTKGFLPFLAWLSPLIYFLSTTLLKIFLLSTGTSTVTYHKSLLSCESTVSFSEERGESLKVEEWRWERLVRALASLQSGMTVLPISLSCFFSVIYLVRAGRKAEKVQRGGKGGDSKQRAAALTVILVTVTYITFNIPTLVYHVNLCRWTASIEPGVMTMEDMKMSHQKHFGTEFERNYMSVVFVILFTACNSVANPLVYFVRIKGFRKFVVGGFKAKCQSFRQSIEIVLSNRGKEPEEGPQASEIN